MKLAVIIGVICVIAAAVVVLLQIWLTTFDPALFTKILVSLGVILAVDVIVALALREYSQEKENRKGGFID